MSITDIYGLFGITVDSTLLGGITQTDDDTQTEVANDALSGEVYNRWTAITAQNPVSRWTTKHVAAWLAGIGLGGSNIGGLTGGLTYYLQKRAAGGGRASGSVHRSLKVNDGLIIPRRLTVTHGQDAELSYEAITIYDGANDPVVIADTVSLPTGLTDAERFTLGPVSVGGVTIDHIRSLEIDFGITATPASSDGDIWPTHISIDSIAPMITFRGVDPKWFSSSKVPLSGKAATHANTEIYLRKRAAGGTFVADATAEHILLTAAGLARVTNPQSTQGNQPAETGIQITTSYDGSNAPIVIDTTSALP